MRSTVDLTPYRPSWIGFDHLFDLLENTRQNDIETFPPFDLEQHDENAYRLRLAVAGFTREDIEITAKANLLVVSGRREEEPERQFLHRGIATRAFERQFQLADYVIVTGAHMHDGLLEIDLKRELPDAVKPRKIEIAAGEPRKISPLSRKRARKEAAAQEERPADRRETEERDTAAVLAGAW
jgi:molecular chaperone IbpA